MLRISLSVCGKTGTTVGTRRNPDDSQRNPELPLTGLETFMATGTHGQVVLREVMDIRQAADYLGISGDTLYRYASEGFVPAFKLGNRWRFRKSLLDGWMDEKSGVTTKAVVVELGKKKPVRSAR
jgi:excisionase family DNA binding protein